MIIKRVSPGVGQFYLPALNENKEILFLENGIQDLGYGDKFYVPDDNIFYEGETISKGIICQRDVIKQVVGSFIIGEQEYYRVKRSSLPEADENDLVIVQERSSVPFEWKGEQVAYFNKFSVMLIVSHKEKDIIPGHGYVILTPNHLGYDNGNIEAITSGYDNNGKLFYFRDFAMRFYQKDVLKLLVKKTEIKIEED